MFGIFGKKKTKKQAEVSAQNARALWDTDYDDIWKIENKNNFLIAMNGWLFKKSNAGEDIEKLSHAERVFFSIFQLEAEVNNGGFSQFFFNSSGSFSNEIVGALREIGANQAAEICQKALAALGCEMPMDLEERQEKLEDVLTDDVDAALSECDAAFCAYPDNLEELNYQFIFKNKAQFAC